MFIAKKVLGSLLTPLPVFMALLVLALLLWRLNSRRLAGGLAALALLFLYFMSIHPVARMLAEPLEFHHPKYDGQVVEAVVVLGGYHRSDERLPITSMLSETSLNRLNEGIRIYRANPGALLLFSGHNAKDKISHAEALAQVAVAMGVPRHDMRLFSSAKDTREEAGAWVTLLADKPFALVTSAMHMPRAMQLFQQQGLLALPAPTGYRAGGQDSWGWHAWVPSATALQINQLAWHEYLGLAWAALVAQGQI